MFIIDSLLTGGVRFVLEQVAAAADAAADDEAVLRERLLDAHARLEQGTLTDDEFVGIERDVLARLREIRDRRDQDLNVAADDVEVTGIEATVVDGHDT